jgi:putative DNA primase/helicase
MDDPGIPLFLRRNPPNSGQQQAPNLDASMESWALYFASRRWAVLPLHSAENGGCSCGDPNCGRVEHPRTQNDAKDACTDPEQIRRWWKQWPDANVGIATGVVSDLLVIDIDPSKGGDESYQQLQNELPGAFAALKVRTGSGGAHLYFGCLKPTPSRDNIRPGISIRADGGYVVAPPSRHVSGSRYRFASSGGLVLPPVPALLRKSIFRKRPRDQRA